MPTKVTVKKQKMAMKKIINFVQVFVFKFLLSLGDVVTDCINGHNFLTRYFLLGLYFASVTRDQFLTLENDSARWGYSTLGLVWFPGRKGDAILHSHETTLSIF